MDASQENNNMQTEQENNAAENIAENEQITENQPEATEVKAKTEESSTTRLVRETFDWVEAAVFAAVTVILLFTFVFRLVTVDGGSMQNTFQNKDKVIISSINYTPQRGDVVVLVQPSYRENHPMIKRIIALGGDTVQVDCYTEQVTVNGEVLQEDYIKEQHIVGYADIGGEPYVVPEGHVYVMGDNRNNSTDSRSSLVGPVAVENILGHVVFRVMPLSGFGFIEG